MNKNDFVNSICEAVDKLIAAAKLENPRKMKPLSINIPICNNESVDIYAEYEHNDDGDIGDLWIDFVYSRDGFSTWLRGQALDPNSIKNAAEELSTIIKEDRL